MYTATYKYALKSQASVLSVLLKTWRQHNEKGCVEGGGLMVYVGEVLTGYWGGAPNGMWKVISNGAGCV